MQTWLPGLNKCSISEEDSKKAFLDLYPDPSFDYGSNLNGHDDIGALDMRRSEETDCATKKQKVRRQEESEAGQHVGNKKIKLTDESCESDLREHKNIVSPSPLKLLKNEKNVSRKRQIGEVNVSQKRCDDEVDCATDLHVTRMKKASNLPNTYQDKHKVVEQKKLEAFNFYSGQEEIHLSKNGSTYRHEVDLKSQQEVVEKDNLGSKRTAVATHLNSGVHETVELHSSSRLPKYHKALNATTGLLDASFCRLSREKIDKQTAFHNTTEPSVDQLETAPRRLKSKSAMPSRSEQEVHGRGLHAPRETGRSEVCRFDSKNVDTPIKESGNKQKTTHNRRLRHPTQVVDVRSPIRMCKNLTANNVLKEAKDMKDTAKRLEDAGLRTESARLYFESALKYLLAASLVEPLNHNDMKCEEADESIRLYIETSRICESCALTFERCEKMDVAALAYKCIEVAHFKVALIQHPVTSKDQKELQEIFQLVNPGDSPSSCDSGAGCIKTPVWLDPSHLGEDVSSPKTADNHVITAHCRPIYNRWFENTTGTICAIEASVKAQNAFAAAINRMGKEDNGLSLVKNVLDINFRNIDDLLRLIQLSMDSINCKCR